MFRIQWLGAAAFIILATTGSSAGVYAQDASKAVPVEGCTTANGVSTGAGCSQKTGGGADAGAVEQGMPATKHQQELLKTDDNAPQGQNMDASGAGGGTLPATQHQQDVLKKPDAAITQQ